MSHIKKIHNRRCLEVIDRFKEDEDLIYKEFCVKTNIHKSQISHVRTGNRSFTLEQVIAICRATNVSADWILGLSSNKSLSKK